MYAYVINRWTTKKTWTVIDDIAIVSLFSRGRKWLWRYAKKIFICLCNISKCLWQL